MSKYIAKIGLEMHCEISKTKTKVFSSCNITGGEKTMANYSNKKLVPEAMSALDKF